VKRVTTQENILALMAARPIRRRQRPGSICDQPTATQTTPKHRITTYTRRLWPVPTATNKMHNQTQHSQTTSLDAVTQHFKQLRHNAFAYPPPISVTQVRHNILDYISRPKIPSLQPIFNDPKEKRKATTTHTQKYNIIIPRPHQHHLTKSKCFRK
jgi:hypothetical protein